MVSFDIPTNVVLSQGMGVGGWGCPIPSKVSRNNLPSLIFLKMPLILLQLLRKLRILGLYIVCKLRRLGVWVGCSVESIPKIVAGGSAYGLWF